MHLHTFKIHVRCVVCVCVFEKKKTTLLYDYHNIFLICTLFLSYWSLQNFLHLLVSFTKFSLCAYKWNSIYLFIYCINIHKASIPYTYTTLVHSTYTPYISQAIPAHLNILLFVI